MIGGNCYRLWNCLQICLIPKNRLQSMNLALYSGRWGIIMICRLAFMPGWCPPELPINTNECRFRHNMSETLKLTKTSLYVLTWVRDILIARSDDRIRHPTLSYSMAKQPATRSSGPTPSDPTQFQGRKTDLPGEFERICRTRT